MHILPIVIGAAKIVTSAGATAVVANAAKASTPLDAGKIAKIAIVIGGSVLSAMVGDAAAKYTEGRIDEATTAFRDVRETAKAAAEEAKETAGDVKEEAAPHLKNAADEVKTAFHKASGSVKND